MALTGVASAQSFTLDSKIINGTTFTSAFDNVVGNTKSEAATATGMDVDRLGYNNCNATVTLKNLFGYTTLEDNQFYMVDTITFAMRYDTVASQEGTYTPSTTSLTLKIGNTAYGTATNAVFTYDMSTNEDGTAKADTALTIGTMTFTFDEAIKLTGDEVLTLSMSGTGNNEKLGFTVLKDKGTVYDAGVQDFTGGWTPVIRISGQLVPEPTTATLSLLALAGLAARRRRK